MDYHIFKLSLIKESNIAICNATKVNLHKNICFNEQKSVFEHWKKFKTIHNLNHYIVLPKFCCSVYLFIAAPVSSICLYKYALFH